MREILGGVALLAAFAIFAIAPALSSSSTAASGSGNPRSTTTPKPTPIPTIALTTPPPSKFPVSLGPLAIALPASCNVELLGAHQDGLGATWRVQCGSADANREVASLAIAQGWQLFPGNPPIGVGLQNYTKQTSAGTVWMQIAYRLDGPALADPFVLVQTYRSLGP